MMRFIRLFLLKTISEFTIIVVYVDDLNIGILEELRKTATYLKNEFEMKNTGKTKFYLGLQIEHLSNEIFVHQSMYIEKVLKYFYMDIAHPLSTPMVVRSLDAKKILFNLEKMVKKFFILKYHIFVLLEHLCIMQIVQDQYSFSSKFIGQI